MFTGHTRSPFLRARRVCLLALAMAASSGAVADDTIDVRARLQPRLDLGDFADAEGNGYDRQLDLYIRRIRLELMGRPLDDLFWIVGAAGDRAGQRGDAGGADLNYAFVNYRLTPTAQIRAGLVKLPYTREGWTSSSRILFIDRTQTVSTAASALGAFIAPHLTLHGRLRDRSIGYSVALTDGLQPGDSDRLRRETVTASDDPGVVLRLELSPESWLEGREAGSHLGVGRHLTVGLNGARQSGVHFEDDVEDRTVIGGDLSFHVSGFGLQAEYLQVSRDGSAQVSPAGWYVQVGHYLTRLHLEPALRFERFDADRPGGDDVTTTFTGGLNWYRHGHDLKFMVNVVHSRFQQAVRPVDGESSRTMLQLQNQIYF